MFQTTNQPNIPVIGLRENLQETMVFTIKYGGFRLKFSLKPIHWNILWTNKNMFQTTNQIWIEHDWTISSLPWFHILSVVPATEFGPPTSLAGINLSRWEWCPAPLPPFSASALQYTSSRLGWASALHAALATRCFLRFPALPFFSSPALTPAFQLSQASFFPLESTRLVVDIPPMPRFRFPKPEVWTRQSSRRTIHRHVSMLLIHHQDLSKNRVTPQKMLVHL